MSRVGGTLSIGGPRTTSYPAEGSPTACDDVTRDMERSVALCGGRGRPEWSEAHAEEEDQSGWKRGTLPGGENWREERAGSLSSRRTAESAAPWGIIRACRGTCERSTHPNNLWGRRRTYENGSAQERRDAKVRKCTRIVSEDAWNLVSSEARETYPAEEDLLSAEGSPFIQRGTSCPAKGSPTSR